MSTVKICEIDDNYVFKYDHIVTPKEHAELLKNILGGDATIPYLMHKQLDIPMSDCQKAYDVAIDYLRSQGKLKGGAHLELKYNIGDEVFVKGIVRSVKVEKGHKGDNTDIIYTVSIGEAYNGATRMNEFENDLLPSVKSGVPTSELRNLYKEMGEFMTYKDKKGEPITNVLDSCRAMLLDVIEAYEEEGGKE